MSETTQETRRPPARRTTRGGGGTFTRRLGPLPVWVWMVLGLAGAVIYSQWRKNKQTAAAAAASTTTTGQTPPFIIQNYTQVPGQPQTATTPTPPPTTTPVGAPSPGTYPIQGGNPPRIRPPVSASPPSTPTSTPSPAGVIPYRVKHGDTLSSIAAKYHTTANALYAYNTSPESGRPASTIATLKDRGPNNLVANELILIPQS